MKKLHLQIFVAFLVVLALCAVAVGLLSRLMWSGEGRAERMIVAGSDLLLDGLPEGAALAPALRARAEPLGLQVSLWDEERRLLARVGAPLPAPDEQEPGLRWRHRGPRASVLFRRDDGRWLAMSAPHDDHHHMALPLLLLAVGLFCLGTYPIARRITRRLEALRDGVERLGGGELGARVAVEGRDEVAELARAFNRSAERIERLLEQQKRVLASASHELRAPLTRLRMTLELLGDDGSVTAERRAELLARGAGDVAELDGLVADVLLAARLERASTPQDFGDVDLAQLARDVAADAGARVEAEALSGPGDAVMLRRMLRNLVDNARRHGGGGEVELLVQRGEGGAVVAVLDQGPGVPEAERERIFEPFYRPQGHSEGRDGGVGLGLSLVRHVAEHHGGSVRYLPRPEGGSRFEVTLPGFA